MVYLNKMIVINMTYAYDTMHCAIYRKFTSERGKVDVLLHHTSLFKFKKKKKTKQNNVT